MSHVTKIHFSAIWRSVCKCLLARRSLALIGVCLVAVGLLVFYSPADSRWFPPCPFRSLTGLYCPGCGSTRALRHLLHGRFVAAFGYNMMMVASVPFLLVNLVSRLFFGPTRILFDEKKLSPVAIFGIWFLILIYGVLRNIPTYPFGFLAPHG